MSLFKSLYGAQHLPRWRRDEARCAPRGHRVYRIEHCAGGRRECTEIDIADDPDDAFDGVQKGQPKRNRDDGDGRARRAIEDAPERPRSALSRSSALAIRTMPMNMNPDGDCD
jgi:hypothetical protein